MRVDDDNTVNPFNRKGLLNDMLNHGQTLNGQELLGNRLGGRKKASAKTSGRDDCLHDAPFSDAQPTRAGPTPSAQRSMIWCVGWYRRHAAVGRSSYKERGAFGRRERIPLIRF